MPAYHLHSYFRSSCSARVRIAAAHLGIPLTYTYIHLLKNAQNSQDYVGVNPSGSVPTLTVTFDDGRKVVIRQSIAILEYLCDLKAGSWKEGKGLLPPVDSDENVEARATIRDLVNIIACDVQPVTNLRIIQKLKTLGSNIDINAWQQDFMSRGLGAYEALLKGCAGQFSVGDNVTMADLCLIPAVDGAVRFGVDVEQSFPKVWDVYRRCYELEAFQEGGWKGQEDCPAELKGKA